MLAWTNTPEPQDSASEGTPAVPPSSSGGGESSVVEVTVEVAPSSSASSWSSATCSSSSATWSSSPVSASAPVWVMVTSSLCPHAASANAAAMAASERR